MSHLASFGGFLRLGWKFSLTNLSVEDKTPLTNYCVLNPPRNTPRNSIVRARVLLKISLPIHPPHHFDFTFPFPYLRIPSHSPTPTQLNHINPAFPVFHRPLSPHHQPLSQRNNNPYDPNPPPQLLQTSHPGNFLCRPRTPATRYGAIPSKRKLFSRP